MYLLCYFLKLIGTGRWSDSGIRFRGDSESIRRCRPFPVPFPSTLQQQKDVWEEEEEEGKGQEGKEEEEITPVYREVLLAVFDGAAVSHQQEQDHHNHHYPGFVWAHHRGDDEEDSSCGIKCSPHSPPAAMGFCEGFADRVAFITFRIPYIYDIQQKCFGL